MKRNNLFSLVLDSISSVVFPEVCYFCGSGNYEEESVICKECRDSLIPVSQPFCNLCGLPLSTLSDRLPDLCGTCLTNPPPYDKARYGVYYEQYVRTAITKFKFHGSLFNVRPIAELLIEAFNMHYSSERFDAIIPVPVHRKRLIDRGYNQVTTLSKKLSKATGVPLDRTALVKIRNTEPQVGLPRSRRLVNLKNVFQICRVGQIANKRILIVDDVSTTGTTVYEAAKAVRKAGASYVAVLVVALRSKGIAHGHQAVSI